MFRRVQDNIEIIFKSFFENDECEQEFQQYIGANAVTLFPT